MIDAPRTADNDPLTLRGAPARRGRVGDRAGARPPPAGRNFSQILTGACYRVVANRILGRSNPPKLADVTVCDRNGHARVALPRDWDTAEVTATASPTGYTSDTSAQVVGKVGIVTTATISFWLSP